MIMSFAFRTGVHPQDGPVCICICKDYYSSKLKSQPPRRLFMEAGSFMLNCGEAEAHGSKSCWQGPVA